MNRTGIEWCNSPKRPGWTWGVVTGCKHGCVFCYADALANGRLKSNPLTPYVETGFSPAFHPERIGQPLGAQGGTVFPASMADLLGCWPWSVVDGGKLTRHTVKTEQVVEQVADVMAMAKQHDYVVLTKAELWTAGVKRNAFLLADAGAWVGTSVTATNAGPRCAGEVRRLSGALDLLMRTKRTVISLEPLMGTNPDVYRMIETIARYAVEVVGEVWLLVGGMTGQFATTYPPGRYHPFVVALAGLAESTNRACGRNALTMFVKDNLRLPAELPPAVRYAYPDGIRHGEPAQQAFRMTSR